MKFLAIAQLSLAILFCTGIGVDSYAQKVKHFQQEYTSTNKKAIRKYEDGNAVIQVNRKNWMAGLALVNEAAQIDPGFVEAHLLISRTYEKMNIGGKYNNKIMKHYRKVIELKPDDPAYVSVYYKMAQYSFKKSKYNECLEYIALIEKYKLASKDYYEKSMVVKENARFALISMTEAVEFSPVMMDKASINRYPHNSHPVLTADQQEMVISVRNNFGFTDENIMISKKQQGQWQPAQSISTLINSPANEGMASISGDGKTLVFASCDRKDGFGQCDLYVSYRKGEDWSEPKNMGPRVNTEFMETEPSISADGRMIYFSCNRPGGMGGRDIWYSKRGLDGVWGSPDNAGAYVNTKEWEVTPFIHADGQTLFFASRGHQGLGGYDIFYSKKQSKKWKSPVNLGYPINTGSNEGSLFITPDYKKGYYEKYTKGSKESHSEIYEFDVPKNLKSEFKCVFAKGTIFDAITKEPLQADIELIDLSSTETNQLITSDQVNGSYILVLTAGKEYALHVKKEGYLFHSLHFDYTREEDFDPLTLDVYLKSLTSKKSVSLRNIFFETGKYELKRKSHVELDRLVKLMQDNPDVKVEVSGHTDNVGSKTANKTLSSNRAKSVKDYLVEKGIADSRVRYVGHGDAKPLSTNSTEEGRSMNRRIDIRIL